QHLANLREGRGEGSTPESREAARAQYMSAVERDLTQPLIQEASGVDDPVTRAVGLQLANLTGIIHDISPMLQALMRNWSTAVAEGDSDAAPPKALNSYLQLMASSTTMSKVFHLLRSSP